MSFSFSGSDLARFVIILYVGVWLCSLCCLKIYSRRKDAELGKILRGYRITTNIRRWGWAGALLFGLISDAVLPEVYVIKQDVNRPRENKLERIFSRLNADADYGVRETFYVERRFVLFGYNGQSCTPYCKYLANESDSTLVLYRTTFFNGKFSSVNGPEKFIYLPPGYFEYFNQTIDYEFESPRETYIMPDSKERYRFITKLTLDLPSNAVNESERIYRQINHIYLPVDTTKHRVNPNDIIMQQLRERFDEIIMENYNGGQGTNRK